MSNSTIYTGLSDLIKKLQPSANKKNKKATYNELLLFVNNNDLSEDDLKLLFTGDQDLKILGLCDLCGKKNRTGKFKDSAKKIVGIIHDLMYLSGKQQKFRDDFVIYDDFIKNMLLGEHYSAHKTRDAKYAKKVLEVIKIVLHKRPGLEMKEYIRKAFIEEVNKGLDEYEIEKKRDEARLYENTNYIDKLVSETATISLEPKTWDDVVKLKNKKLLTTEFLSLNYNQKTNNTDRPTFIDENKELEEEIINNFVDPLTKGSKKLNFLSFSEEDRKKMHLQYETYDPVFFLEKLYADITLKEFAEFLENLEENLNQVGVDDGNLIDKNIYKYLDCKKLLDFLVEKFKTQTYSNLQTFKENLTNLQSQINETLQPIKTSFDLILKSKSSKEIILKFSKFFQMKNKIDHFLKFSSFEELADYLKKINVEIKEISQNRFIYGEFYEFFSKTIEHFKGVLMKIIKESSVNDLVIKHFRYLLEFDVEADTVDYLLNGLKEKICEKIKNDLEYTENFEIRNFKEFFCDEFNVENINEETFADTLKKADKFILTYDKFVLNEEASTMAKTDEKKKNLINVESILRTLYNEIKGFLFMMKVLEENINLKIIHLSSQKNTKFSTIVTEIYFTLFEKLKQFLFLSNFNIYDILIKNYNEKKVSDILNIDSTLSFIKNDYKFENDVVVSLFKFYEQNSNSANTLFNENFNKNTLQNLSNLLIDLFDLFEIYLDKDTIEALNDSKTVTIERIFMAFLNEKIIYILNNFNEERTINFFDTHLSIFNYSAFNFTKSFLKNIFKSYKNIIEFYINILSKSKDVNLNHEVIYHSLFFLLKSFLLKFYDFYQTESNGDFKRLNCLIVEIIKNYNYLKTEIKTILKAIFKNKVKEYAVYLVDLDNFLNCLKNMFTNLYIRNASKVLNNLFIPINKSEVLLINSIGFNCTNYTYNFYERYNDFLLYENESEKNSFTIFTDVRSVIIDMILQLAESIKVFYQLELENLLNSEDFNSLDPLKKSKIFAKESANASGINLNERLITIISDIIYEFFDSVLDQICSDENNIPKLPNNFKFISQLYIEIELLQEILKNFVTSKEKIKEKIKILKNLLFEKLIELRNKKVLSNLDESFVFSEDEIQRKASILDDYSTKYSSYLKCYKISL